MAAKNPRGKLRSGYFRDFACEIVIVRPPIEIVADPVPLVEEAMLSQDALLVAFHQQELPHCTEADAEPPLEPKT